MRLSFWISCFLSDIEVDIRSRATTIQVPALTTKMIDTLHVCIYVHSDAIESYFAAISDVPFDRLIQDNVRMTIANFG